MKWRLPADDNQVGLVALHGGRMSILDRECQCGCGKLVENRKLGAIFHNDACKSRNYYYAKKLVAESGMLKLTKHDVMVAVPKSNIADNECKKCGNLEAIAGQYAGSRQMFTCTQCGVVARITIKESA